jgi:hypothetical protein
VPDWEGSLRLPRCSQPRSAVRHPAPGVSGSASHLAACLLPDALPAPGEGLGMRPVASTTQRRPSQRDCGKIVFEIPIRMFLGKKLGIDQEVTLVLKDSVLKEEVGSKQDGSVHVCYEFKATEVQVTNHHEHEMLYLPPPSLSCLHPQSHPLEHRRNLSTWVYLERPSVTMVRMSEGISAVERR